MPAMASNANLYQISDYVYFESSPSAPFAIRRIEELNKSANGSVEAKVLCFFRRRDIPPPLLILADKHDTGIVAKPVDENGEEEKASVVSEDDDGLTVEQRHHVKHRELFLSRQVETLPASQIRGKCYVTLLNETESYASYLNKEDTFFYSLVYDPQQKTLLADRGEIRVGLKYQADPVTLSVKPNGVSEKNSENLEELLWDPENHLCKEEIEEFLVLAKSVGTFARAVDSSGTVKTGTLQAGAAAACRDATSLYAMKLLHKCNYDWAKSVRALVPSGSPVLCRDEMEDWSGAEAALFEEAMDKYGKDFHDIRSDFLPWKSMKSLVEFYYLWKTTDRYVAQSKAKALEADAKLKQVYVPSYNKQSQAAISNDLSTTKVLNGDGSAISGGHPCASCATCFSHQWYTYGGSQRLCSSCWQYWKKFGGLPNPKAVSNNTVKDEPDVSMTIVVDQNYPPRPEPKPLLAPRSSSASDSKSNSNFRSRATNGLEALPMITTLSSGRSMMKTRIAFVLQANQATKLSRYFCKDLISPRRLARCPLRNVSLTSVKASLVSKLARKDAKKMDAALRTLKTAPRPNLNTIAMGLGQVVTLIPAILAPIDKSSQGTGFVAFPKPEKRKDGSLIYDEVPSRTSRPSTPQMSSGLFDASSRGTKRKAGAYEQPLMGADYSSKRLAPVPAVPGTGLTLQKGSSKLQNFAVTSLIAPQMGIAAGLAQMQQQVLQRTVGRLNTSSAIPSPVPERQKSSHKNQTPLSYTPGRRGLMSWVDAPDDVYFKATGATKSLRKQVDIVAVRRAARRPWRIVK
ncbi:unnamed protein product [Notodromas monacha]|uniref:Metastasis-associated protein MTA3 n=1 Tax=Notodromas monacha TaxID=399045 RepID=A0A7R9GJC4_9CRUS|nr:unnamed protein product [Notodromas monacha]CAG0922703.1 unnamed protein product [Notodromas monacha]